MTGFRASYRRALAWHGPATPNRAFVVATLVLVVLALVTGGLWYTGPNRQTDAVPATAALPAATGASTSAVAAAIRAALPATKVDSVLPSVIPGLYEVKAGANTLYGEPSGRYLVVGHIYDLKTAKDLTQPEGEAASAEGGAADTATAESPAATAIRAAATGAARAGGGGQDAATAHTIGWDSLPLEAAVHWGTPGKPKLAVFSDTRCPYCQQLHGELQQLAGGYDIFEIMYPVHGDAKAEMAAVLCAKDPKAALDRAFAGQPTPSTASASQLAGCNSKLDEVLATAQHLHIEGTPTLVAGDGRVQAGASGIQQVREWLATPAAQQPQGTH